MLWKEVFSFLELAVWGMFVCLWFWFWGIGMGREMGLVVGWGRERVGGWGCGVWVFGGDGGWDGMGRDRMGWDGTGLGRVWEFVVCSVLDLELEIAD